jgi:hypothetical protein
MKTVFTVSVISNIGVEWFYAGAETKSEALEMAAARGYVGDGVDAKMVPNREAVQPDEWRFLSVDLSTT